MEKIIKDQHAVVTIFLAFGLWLVIFRLELLNFWLAMSLAVTVLCCLAFIWGSKPVRKIDFNLRAVIVGVSSAVLLYGIFFLGNVLVKILFDFAANQISAIYSIRNQGEALIIFIVLFFITSPGEEIFWRGFLQKWAVEKYGRFKGYLLSSLLYAGVHLVSGNFMLVMAALVAGLFWGFIYLKEENMVPLIISHALWTVGIFVLFPVV